MGNRTVTPATSGAPVTSTFPRTSVSSPNFDVPNAPIQSPTFPASSNYPKFIPPVATATENISTIFPIPTTSPTFVFPVTSPSFAVRTISPISVLTPTTAIPIHSPNNAIPIQSLTTGISRESPTAVTPVNSPTTAAPLNSSTAVVPIKSPTSRDAVPSPTTAPPVNSSTAVVPVNSSTSRDAIPSPITAIPVNSPTPKAPLGFSPLDDPLRSSTPNLNVSPVISPDTSAVSPTLDLPHTPSGSPVPTDAPIPVKPVVAPNSSRRRPPTRIVHDASTSPMVSVPASIPAKSAGFHPSEVSRKQTVPKDPVTPSASTPIQAKSPMLSSAERHSKWSIFEQHCQENQKKLTDTPQHTQRPSQSTISPLNTDATDIKVVPILPHIVAVPSFSLRSTAVCNPSSDRPLLSERTQSIHNDLSIFKYYLTYDEEKHSIGDHTKATMFKMDTRLKQTPLPVPSLAFLNKNFSDGTDETDDNKALAPSFGALGLQHGLETERIDAASTGLRLHEKQQQRKLQQSALRANDTFGSNNSLQFVSSTVISQSDYAAIEQTFTQNNRQPLTSILKKPSSQFNTKPNVDNTSSTVSFTLARPSPANKASQSISRSERLIHGKRITP